MTTPLLEVDNLTIQYQTERGPLTAVSGASFSVKPSEYKGLVGESGSGKSTIAKAVIGGLDDNGHVTEGTIKYDGTEIQDFSEKQLNKEIRWKEVSYIPQSAMNSLDPLSRLSNQALEIANIHTDLSEDEALRKFKEMFEVVGIQESRIDDYPHQFSGGMEQRAIIALALFLEPSLIIADEPTTALDVIMQDQVFKYLDRIREEVEASMLLITHDISVVLESCDSMTILHSGQVAESGSVTDVYDNPRHPYTYMLQNAFPDHRYPDQTLGTIEGHPPETIGDVTGCTFTERCPLATEECETNVPPLDVLNTETAQADSPHQAACFMSDEIEKLKERSDDTVVKNE
jgi:oligopeptide/dipeptide ABC transporter ATP-binding protein